MKWTDKQQQAIDARGSSVIVSAAAGSGKTAILVERITKILLDEDNKTPADKLVVVTFTNDAAAEIKKRLRDALSKKASENPENQWLKEQQILLRKAKISTIHTFCYSIIRDNLDDEKLTSSFRILDTTEAELLKSEAIDNILNKWHEEHTQEIYYLLDNICDNDDSNIELIIKELDDFLSSVTFRDVWIEKAKNELSVPYYESEYYKRNKADIEEELSETKAIVEKAYENSFGIFSDEPYLISEIIQSDKNILEIVYNNLTNNICNPLPDFQKFTQKKKNCEDPDEKARIKNIRDNYKEKILSISEKTDKFILNGKDEFEKTYAVFDIIIRIYNDFREEELSLKKEKNSLSFADAEEMVIDILCEHDKEGKIYPKEILEKISSLYDVIMIDEFQDSNNKQDMIFKLLSKDKIIADDKIIYGDNVFIVGDVKQSIYSFRQANPDNFTNIINSAVPYGEGNSGTMHKIYLNTNFRSSNGVINFVNSFFRDYMSELCGDVKYDENEQLNYGSKAFENSEKLNVSCKTQFLVISDEIDKNDKAEEKAVAEKINNMLINEAVVFDKDGTSRKCKPSDFCIIVRKNSIVSDFRKALSEYCISVEGEKEEGYLQSEEIAVLINMLRIINNPALDLACTSVLMSPMFMFSSDDMLILKDISYSSENKKGRSVISSLMFASESPDVPDYLKNKSEDFLEKFDELRKFAVYSDLTSLVQKIYEVTGYSAVVGYNKDGKKKTSNLRLMFHYTKEYSEKNGSAASLSGFLIYIDRMNKNKANFTQATSEKNDSVQIKTYHGSKGLEFPFVFVVGTHTKFSDNDKKKNITLLPDGSVSFKMYNKDEYKTITPIEFNRINKIKSIKQTSEEMRLFYVALTRARQQLFITFDNRKIAKKSRANISTELSVFSKEKVAVNAKSMAEWLFMYLYDKCNSEDFTSSIQNEHFEVENINESIIPSGTTISPEIENQFEIDKTIIDNLLKNKNFKYNSDMFEVEARKSVSDIIKDNEQKKNNESNNIITDVQEFRRRPRKWSRPDFMLEKGNLKSNERGTAVHKFFQYVDFENASLNIENERKRLLENGFLNQVYIDAVPDEYIKNFISSGIYAMISETNKEKIYREKQILVKMKDLYFAEPIEILEKYKNTDTMLKGVIDLYFIDKNGDIILVDYKTDNLKTEQEFIFRYSNQINIYAAALKCIEGKKVKKMYLYSFVLKKEIEIPFL